MGHPGAGVSLEVTANIDEVVLSFISDKATKRKARSTLTKRRYSMLIYAYVLCCPRRADTANGTGL
jgi:hypothetical protein